MSTEEIEITIDEPKTSQDVGTTYEELSTLFNSTKQNNANAVENLAGDTTLRGFENVNELIADTMNQIQEYINNGVPQTFMQRASSKTLAVIDPKNSWIGKWSGKANENANKEKIKEMSINQVVDNLVQSIETKRQALIDKLPEAYAVGEALTADAQTFDLIEKKAKQLLELADPATKEYLNLKFLITTAAQSRTNILTSIDSELKPIIAAATLSVEKVGSLIPTIESNLKYKGALKNFQQNVSDLDGMVKSAIGMTEQAGDIIRKDIHNSVLSSIEMLKETGLDTKRLAKVQQEELEHQKKINSALGSVQKKINDTFEETQKLSHNLLEHREESNNKLLNSFGDFGKKNGD